MNYNVFLIGLIVLIIASITDIKKREVPDWLSFSFIFTSLFLNIILSLVQSNFLFVLNSFTGLIFGFLLALLLFYTGQWGGGDSKILIGVFTLLGINFINIFNLFTRNLSLSDYLINSYWIIFLINLIFAGAIYGLFYMFFIIIKKNKTFFKNLKKSLKDKKNKNIKKISYSFSFIILLTTFVLISFKSFSIEYYFLIFIGLLPTILFFIIIVSNSTEQIMIKKIRASKVTIGDWVAEKVIFKKRTRSLIKDAFKDFLLKTESKIDFEKFMKIFSLSYLRFIRKNNVFVILNKKELKKTSEFLKKVLDCSSITSLKKKANSFKLNKKEINNLISFLESQNIYFNKRIICGEEKTGINESQFNLIQELYKKNKIKFLKIKNGIPFIPSFLIAFVLLYIFLNYGFFIV